MNQRILGIDPGIHLTGYGLVVCTEHSYYIETAGVVETDKAFSDPKRLSDLYNDCCTLRAELKPTCIVIEHLFFGRNKTTMLRVAQARGVILAALAVDIDLIAYTPMQIKSGVTGDGKASKKQMQEMIKKVFNLESIIKPDDANDAVGMALHHARLTIR